MKRRAFVSFCAAAGGLLVLGMRRPAAQTVTPQIGDSITAYGAVGDGTTDDGPALLAACNDLRDSVLRVPAGTYLIGNPLTIRDFSGTILFEVGAMLRFADRTRPGLTFSGGANAQILNYRAGWRDVPVTRLLAGGGIEFQDALDPHLESPIIDSSNSAGIIFYHCIRPQVIGAVVSNTLADGIHFANCDSPVVENSRTTNTGDDGVAFVNYATGANNTGGVARNITVQASKARGITVVGQSNVEVRDFSVYDTASSGVLCAYDASYNTRVPDNVIFANGRIERSGVVTPTKGNRYGAEIDTTGAVTFDNLDIVDSEDRGLSVSSPQGRIVLRDIKISGTRRNSGAEIRAADVTINGMRIEGAPRYGVYIANTPNVRLDDVTVVDSAASFDLPRAIWFDGNGQISANRLVVVDTRASTLGNIIGAGPGQRGTVTGVLFSTVDGQGVRIENSSTPGLTFPAPVRMQTPAAPAAAEILPG